MKRLAILAIALLLCGSAGAAQFSMTGEARLSQPETVQANSRFSLQAGLSASPRAANAVVQSSLRFALFAALTSTSLACYNDTIFRDDFDGDGL